MSAETQTKKFNEFTLSEAAKFDHDNGAREKLTGWGIICKERCKSGNSRSQRIGDGLGKRLGKVPKEAAA